MNINQEYKILSFSTSETKMKKTMGNLTLEAVESGEIFNAKLWEEDLNKYEKRYFKANNIVYVEEGTYSEQYKNLIIKRMTLVKETLAGLSKTQVDELFTHLTGVIDLIKNDGYRLALKELYLEYEDLLKIAPAAKNNHHNYVGGLIEHISECVCIAKANFDCFIRPVDEDLIITACLMHDFGKIFEYKIDVESGFVEVDESFIKRWVSHTQYGFAWANQNEFYDLARIIAGHHGRKDWGAIIDLDEKNLEPEIYLMHHIDDISAKFGAITTADIENIKEVGQLGS
ncbi:MAG: HDIG domain-containing protein [Candidatus Gastranaerophilales bacterium]|nr:HDIG domain-containing protein [Candidatus Gastranaerophilales bacterium]